MTDFRRPDLDLWEEEEDSEDARPTIVSERPSSARAPEGALRAPVASKRTKAADATIPFGTIPHERKTPEVQRSSLVQRLIEQGALEDEAGLRNSTEELRDSELDLMKLTDGDDVEALPVSDSETTIEPRVKADPLKIVGVESEPATDDQVPTVSVKRPLPPLPEGLKLAETREPSKASFSEREITERMSIPGMVGSIAPATRTFRPEPKERKGLPIWQTAIAAIVLLGGGLSIAKFRAARHEESPEQVSAVSGARRTEVGPLMASAPVEPAPAAEPPATSPPEEAPTPDNTNVPASAAAPVPAPPAEQPLDSAPKSIAPPVLPTRDETAPVGRMRRVREPRAIASPADGNQEVALTPAPAKPAPAAAEPLPAQPSREQVVSSLDAVTGELQKCVGDRHGVAQVTVTVRPAGVVSYAVVSGDYAGTTEGSCIARAVRSAKFPAFGDPMLRVTYPFNL